MKMAHALTLEVEKLVKQNEVVIYMKGSPEFPMCGFSARAVAVLKAAGVGKIASFDVLSDDDMWTALEEFTQWPTVPQIFIKGKFVGGCDIVTEMFERGELQEALKG
jgi:monothiol glutaredoxin